MKRFLLALSIFASVCAHAQDEATKKSFLSLGCFGGLSNVDAGATNDQLKAANLPTIPADAVFNVGLVLAFDLHDMIFNDISFNSIRSKSSKNGINLKNSQYNIDFNINYTLFHYHSHFLYPSIGFGWQGNQLDLKYSTSANTLAQSLVGNATEKTYTNSYLWYINPRISYDYALGKRQNVYVGVKFGYRIGLNSRQWNIQDNAIDGPKMNASGYYVLLGFTLNLGY